MKKAIISTGGKQYLVAEGDILDIELIDGDKADFTPLLLVDGDNVEVGQPQIDGAKVSVKVLNQIREDKVIAIRYKAKKRVHKRRGHRQSKAQVQVVSIDSK